MRSYLTHPHFSDARKNTAARVLYPILLTMLGILLVARPAAVLVNWLADGRENSSWLPAIFGATTLLALLWAVRKGYVFQVSWLLIGMVILLMTSLVALTGGAQSPNVAGYMVALTLAGVLLGGLPAVGVAVVSILAIVLVEVSIQFGILPPSSIPTVPWVNYLVFFFLTAYIYWKKERP